MAKINRKIFKYKESIILLKKALEYNWWTDVPKAQRLTSTFKRWLAHHYPEELPIFDEKFEVARVFHHENGYMSHRTHKADHDLKPMREFLHLFFESQKMKNEMLMYDVVHKRQAVVNQRTIDLELEIYNELSFNFLQLNKKEESKLFAEKYESGYTEPEDSKIILLSRELINSIQKRVPGWSQMTFKNFELLFFVDIFEIVVQQR